MKSNTTVCEYMLPKMSDNDRLKLREEIEARWSEFATIASRWGTCFWRYESPNCWVSWTLQIHAASTALDVFAAKFDFSKTT